MACPSDSELALLAAGAVDAEARGRIVEHTESCGDCRRVVAALMRGATADVRTPPPPDSDRRSSDGESTWEAPGRGAELAATELASGDVIGRFLVGDRLGAGGMGVVYTARDPALGRDVAVKVLRHAGDAAARARLQREAQTLARLTHPNVVTVYAVGAHRGRDFIAMELVRGHTLAGWLAAERRRPRDVMRMLLAAGEGLAAAHRAGVVHRDFKPSNVLVGDDGRVCVTDFGLARAEAVAAPSLDDAAAAPIPAPTPPASEERDGTDLTRAGAVLGTPRYMAPEQHRGLPADARSDQFAFCVTAYEALFGARPFRGDDAGEIARSIAAGVVQSPGASSSRVAGGVRRAVLRGLAADPTERHPSMDALLARLRRASAAPRRRAVAAIVAAIGLLVGAGGFLWGARTHTAAASCRGGAARVATAWDTSRGDAIARAFAATGVSYAADAAERARRELGRYAAEWSAMYDASCVATRRGEQSGELHDLRVQCLDGRLAALAAAAEVLAAADAPVVEHATDAAAALPPLSGCEASDALRQRQAWPVEQARSLELADAYAVYARASIELAAGHDDQALPAIDRALADATRLGYRPLEADALTLRSAVEAMRDPPRTVETLRAALIAAEAGGVDDVAAEALMRLAALTWSAGGDLARAEELLGLADAKVERLGRPPVLETMLAARRAVLAAARGDLAGQRRELERAVAIQARLGDSGAAEDALTQLAAAQRDVGDVAAARATSERAEQMAVRLYGANHPRTADAILEHGRLEMRNGDAKTAVAMIERALAIGAAGRGAEGDWAAGAENELAFALLLVGRGAESEARMRHSVAIYERIYGTDHMRLATMYGNLARILVARDKVDEAVGWADRAVAIARRAYPAGHPNLGLVLNAAGEVAYAADHFDRALTLHREALAIFEAKHGPDHPKVAMALDEVGTDLDAMGRYREARPILERSLGLRQHPRERAYTQFQLAHTIWHTGEQRRARELAMEARAALAGDPAETDFVAQVDQWLGTHPL